MAALRSEETSCRSKSLQIVLSPVLVLGHTFGISLFYWRNKKLLRIVYKLFFCVIMVAAFIHEQDSIKYWQEHANGVHQYLVQLDSYSWWFCYYVNFFITTLRSERIVALIDNLEETSIVLPLRTRSTLFRFNLINLAVNVILLILFNVLGYNWVWPNGNYTYYTSLIYILGDITILFCFYEFIQIVHLIGEMFKQINYNFKRIRRSNQYKSNIFGFQTGEVVKLREWHLFLTKTSKEVNDCFSEQLLVILYFAMVETIYATRSILGDFSIEDLEESILNIFCDCLWLLPYVVTVLQMVVFCEKTTTESKKTLKTVHHLMNIYYYDGETLKELELFALQVHQHPIRFNVRLFDLHYPFLNTVGRQFKRVLRETSGCNAPNKNFWSFQLLSGIITYFVVIATFQGESDNGQLINWNFKPDTTTTVETTEKPSLVG
ncbi:hypothetical protein RUM43_013107 [Polyplax serrata]|uniref:Gustatory receptor n=1 Tax=Polyplax serrata TaxID=468196 RepID=A0AAN8P2Q3_POLSC